MSIQRYPNACKHCDHTPADGCRGEHSPASNPRCAMRPDRLAAIREVAEEWVSQQSSGVKTHCGRRILAILDNTEAAR